ncbi:MAG TPA: helix-turn-helix transcriptional regulator [Fastidiosipila sp.]|nr:helix-turn-helix transcriptional regulator [Fastidiosipila sp.]
MATKYQDYLKEQLQNPDFKTEYDALEAEYRIIQAMIDARKKSGMTQKELSEKTGIAQSDISRLESGNGNPSIRTLRRLASGMNMTLTIDFKPVKTRD